MGYKIVVLDIGKTNKKLFVYDSNLRCLNPDEEGTQFDPVTWETPSGLELECDDMESIRHWMIQGLRDVGEKYDDIRAISISTHGATIAMLGEQQDRVFPGDGGLVFPIISYENDVGQEADEAFYEDIGMTPEEAQRSTATPRLSWFLNHAKLIHFLQERAPSRWQDVSDILMFPQYVAYLLTDEMGVEPTYLGCHGYLLDSSGQSYSAIADRLGATDLLPDLPFSNSWDVLGNLKPGLAEETGISEDCVVTMGAHDSNLALVPYLAQGIDNFVVQDSGTWVVTMAPLKDGEAEFADEELGREVFFNRDIYGDPVKTTIFRGGAEFDFYRSNVLDNKPRPKDMDRSVMQELVEGQKVFSLPTIERGAGLFPDSVAKLEGIDTIFRDASTAWHVIDLGLAVQGWYALQLAAGENPHQVFIEGNIGQHNPIYRSVISALFHDAQVRYGSMGGAAFGAAILGAAAVEEVRPEELADRYEIVLQDIEDLGVDHEALRDYVQAFIERLEE